ncbi:MAG: hypothetical protein IKR19_07585 [Acholeplasmatales bacterium]|nr:hypothetical protein [Acholeplasmatales bacterium]
MIYQEALVDFIKCSKKYIPRKLKSCEHLRVYHRYWLPEFGLFKVRDTSYDSGIEFFYITYDNDSKQAVLSYPIYNIRECYELLKNHTHIEEDSVINNRVRSFTGAEIRFWFISNNIDFTDIENYSGFVPYLEYGNKESIRDSQFYQCRRNKKQNKFDFIEVDRRLP